MSENLLTYLILEKVSWEEAPFNFKLVDRLIDLGATHLRTSFDSEGNCWIRLFRYRCTEEDLLKLRLEHNFTFHPENNTN